MTGPAPSSLGLDFQFLDIPGQAFGGIHRQAGQFTHAEEGKNPAGQPDEDPRCQFRFQEGEST